MCEDTGTEQDVGLDLFVVERGQGRVKDGQIRLQSTNDPE